MKRDALILDGNEGIIIASNGTQVVFFRLLRIRVLEAWRQSSRVLINLEMQKTVFIRVGNERNAYVVKISQDGIDSA